MTTKIHRPPLFLIPNDFIDIHLKNLSYVEIKIALACFRHPDIENIEKLGSLIDLDQDTVKNSLMKLNDLGIIKYA